MREAITSREEGEWFALALLESGAIPMQEPEPQWKKWKATMEGVSQGPVRRRVKRGG